MIESFLLNIVENSDLHRRWLNTLSYLENCGARKIARCEHPTLVKSEMLKHAAEEFRHAYHLKKQITKIGDPILDYTLENLLGGYHTLRYLDKLELEVCRVLKHHGCLSKHAAYLLVTYAIEVRASQLYPLYQKMLNEVSSPVSVRFIIAEEEHHLADISAELVALRDHEYLKQKACEIEERLFINAAEAIWNATSRAPNASRQFQLQEKTESNKEKLSLIIKEKYERFKVF